MGSFLPTTHRRTFPPPVQTRGIISSCITPLNIPLTLILDELLQSYSHRLAIGPRGISEEQQHWFERCSMRFALNQYQRNVSEK